MVEGQVEFIVPPWADLAVLIAVDWRLPGTAGDLGAFGAFEDVSLATIKIVELARNGKQNRRGAPDACQVFFVLIDPGFVAEHQQAAGDRG